MTNLVKAWVALAAVAGIFACHTDETQPSVMPMNSAPAPGTYPPPGDPAATSTVPTTPTAPPVATAPPAPGSLATPGPMAFACTTDAQCGLHRCNTQFSKCAFPCATDADCSNGSACIGAGQPVATCIPKMGGQ